MNTASTQQRPSFDQLQLAAHHGLQAQLEALDYMKDSWCLADMDRDSIRRLQAQVLTLEKECYNLRMLLSLPPIHASRLTYPKP